MRESREDWLVVVVSTVGLAISMLYVYSLGALIIPVQAEFGWPRGEIVGGLTFVSVISVAMAPLVGWGIDRLGSRRIALAGMTIFCAAIAALALTTPHIWHWWATWALIACGSVLIKPTVWMAAIGSRFVERRGLAIGLALSGTGICSATAPYITHAMVDTWGWRTAVFGLGAGGAAIALPLMLLFFRDRKGAPGPRRADAPAATGLEVGEAMRSSRFLRMALAGFTQMFAVMALTVHFVPIMVQASISRADAAAVAGTIGVAAIISHIAVGYLLDRFSGPLIGGLSFGLPVVACLLLLNFDGSLAAAAMVGAVIGLSLGAGVDVMTYLASRYFGMRHYGLVFGTMGGMMSLGIGFGPTFAGMMFDSFGSYDMMFSVLIPIFALGAVLIGSLGRYPDFGAPGRVAAPDAAPGAAEVAA